MRESLYRPAERDADGLIPSAICNQFQEWAKKAVDEVRTTTRKLPMSDTLAPERIAELREFFYRRGDHHPSCLSRNTGNQCDCYAQRSQRAHDLLDAIAEEHSTLRAERDAALTAKRQADTYAADIEGCLESIAQAVTGDSDTAGIVSKVEALVAGLTMQTSAKS